MLWVCLLCVILAFPKSYPLAFCVGVLFHGVVIGVLSSLAINLLRKITLVVLLSKHLLAV